MANHRSLWTAAGLALMLTGGVTAPTLVGAVEMLLTRERKVEVRKIEEKRTASLDKSYARQTKALAKQYKAAAKLVEKQGDDPTALLEAAAYFDNEAKTQEGKEKNQVKNSSAVPSAKTQEAKKRNKVKKNGAVPLAKKKVK